MSKIDFKALQKEIPFKWKVQAASEWNCLCVGYIDARQAMDLLDEVVGPDRWSDKYFTMEGKLYCELSILTEHGWVSKIDCGVESNTEAEKGEVSDAFKRAAVKWGIGRFLYRLPLTKTKSVKDKRGKWQPADANGKQIWGGDQLTDYINSLQGREMVKKSEAPKQAKKAPVKKAEPKKDPAKKSEASDEFKTALEHVHKLIPTAIDMSDVDYVEKVCEKFSGFAFPDVENHEDITLDQLRKTYKALNKIIKDANNEA